MSTTETLLDLKVHKLSNESYAELIDPTTPSSIDNSALYLTPEEEPEPLVIRLGPNSEGKEREGYETFTYTGSEAKIVDLTYSNSTPIVEGIGSIKPNQTFSNVPIKTMLDWILYPYIDIDVGTTATATPGTGDYDVKNLPTLQSVVLNVTKNSATNLSFELWDTTKDKKVAGPLTEANLSSNKLTFSNLNYAIDTTRIFAIKYSYKKDDGTRVPASGTMSVTVGTFTITFTNPDIPTPTSNLATNSWCAGQTASVTAVTVSAPTLNSAEKITKLALYKDGTQVGNTVTNPTFPYTFSRTDNLTSTSTSDVTNTYKVRAYFKYRTSTDATWKEPDANNGWVDSSNLTITFKYSAPAITIEGLSSYTDAYSKLDPPTIPANSISAKVTKNSSTISNVSLSISGSSVATDSDTQSAMNSLKADGYSNTSQTVKFDHNAITPYSNTTITVTAKHTSGTDITASKQFTLYAPYCYGFVPKFKQDGTEFKFSDIDLNVIKSLEKKAQQQTSIMPNGVINTTGPAYAAKFLLAVPTSGSKTFTKATSDGKDAMTAFEKGGEVIELTLADNSTKQKYQIFISNTASADAPINYKFE